MFQKTFDNIPVDVLVLGAKDQMMIRNFVGKKKKMKYQKNRLIIYLFIYLFICLFIERFDEYEELSTETFFSADFKLYPLKGGFTYHLTADNYNETIAYLQNGEWF